MKTEFLQLAHTYDPKKHSVAGVMASEKMDGQRCFWDGGVTRGLKTTEVPWANTGKDTKEYRATGMWSRYGKVIMAPDWWLDELPSNMILDGELFHSRGMFQHVESVVRNKSGTSDWHGITYRIFDIPPVSVMFKDREIKTTIWTAQLRGCLDFFMKRAIPEAFVAVSAASGFQTRYDVLRQKLTENEIVRLHPQELLPFSEADAKARLNELLDSILQQGGEGVILKSRSDIWNPVRAKTMLKYKPWNDMEATVIGYTTGRETDKGSKLLGLMGALICKIPAGEFKVSGFTDEERALSGFVREGRTGFSALEWASGHPDEVCPDWISNLNFPIGTKVTVKYRELTDSGLPKEGRYWRKFHA